MFLLSQQVKCTILVIHTVSAMERHRDTSTGDASPSTTPIESSTAVSVSKLSWLTGWKYKILWVNVGPLPVIPWTRAELEEQTDRENYNAGQIEADCRSIPVLEYAIVAFNCLSAKNCRELQKLQNYSLRVILYEDCRTHVKDVHMETNLMYLSDRRHFHTASHVYKCLHNLPYKHSTSGCPEDLQRLATLWRLATSQPLSGTELDSKVGL